MTEWSAAVAAGCLALAAMVVSWPVPGRRARQRAVLAEAAPRGVPAVAAPQRVAETASQRVPAMAASQGVLAVLASQRVPGMAALRAVLAEVASRGVPAVAAPRAVLAEVASRGVPAVAAPRAVPGWSAGRGSAAGSAWWRRPGRVGGLLLAAGVAVAALWGGPVAAAVAGAYGLLALRGVVRRSRRRVREARRAELRDRLASAAADLRAGLPVSAALPDGPAEGSDDGDPALAALHTQVRAAVQLAGRTGAPLAEVIERIEADARGADRARAVAAAQIAGAQATAWLLAGLPVAGISLGFAIGTDPLAVLLHTPLGAASALGAVGLQLAGLAWAARITRPTPATQTVHAAPAARITHPNPAAQTTRPSPAVAA